MKILIVEDEPLAANNLIRQIQALGSQYQILGVADTIRKAIRMLKENEPDLLFLDIQLSDGLSFDIFRQYPVQCPIIFTTAFDEFAIQAFEHNSVAYLLKPITKEKVAEAFSKLEKMKVVLSPKIYPLLFAELSKKVSSSSFKRNFLVKKGSKLIPLTSNQIAYFIAEDKCVFIITMDDQRYLCNYTLQKLESLLNPNDFFRISRQYLVNRRSISSLEPYSKGQVSASLLSTKEKIVVSRQQTILLKEWLQE